MSGVLTAVGQKLHEKQDSKAAVGPGNWLAKGDTEGPWRDSHEGGHSSQVRSWAC